MIKSIQLETNDGDYSISALIDDINGLYVMPSFECRNTTIDNHYDFIWDSEKWLVNTLYRLLKEDKIEELIKEIKSDEKDTDFYFDEDLFIECKSEILEIFEEAFKMKIL